MPRTHNSPLAIAYAKSLLELASGQNQAPAIGQELSALAEIIQQNPIFGEYLRDPGISSVERWETLQRLLRGKASPLVMNFLGVLNEKGRLGLLPHLGSAYDELLDEQLGKIEVDVTVAQRLAPDQLEQVGQRVSAALGKQAVVHQYVDDSIIGGLILRVQDRLIDASVRAQLQAMRRQMMMVRGK